MTVFLTVSIIVLVILSIYAAAFDTAPEAYEDESGWHEGRKP